MRASPTLWTVATLSLLSAVGCQSGSRPSIWPFNKTPSYSNWSKTPPAEGTPHADPSLPSQAGGAAPAFNPNTGYAGQNVPTGGATDPNGYTPVDYNAPVGSAVAGAPNQGYPSAGSTQQGPYGSNEQQQTGAVTAPNSYAGGGAQGGYPPERTADARYGSHPAAGGASAAGYDTGSPYDAPANQGGDHYAPTQGDRYSAPSNGRYAAPADRYNTSASDASAGASNPADPAWEPGKSDYVPGKTDYQPRGAKPYQSPGGQYRSDPNAPSSNWRPGGTKDYPATNSGASTRAGFNGGAAAGGDAQKASYDASRYTDTGATTAGGESAPLGDRYGAPAATTAGGYGQDGGPMRR
jgi:hypothetical protein